MEPGSPAKVTTWAVWAGKLEADHNRQVTSPRFLTVEVRRWKEAIIRRLRVDCIGWIPREWL